MSDEKVGLINEIGDLGLGFTPITENEKKTIEADKKEETPE